jgi:hypothetical protein
MIVIQALCVCGETSISVLLNMIEPNNGQNQLAPRPQTKAEIVAQREQVRQSTLH